jgi:hypothetical protein
MPPRTDPQTDAHQYLDPNEHGHVHVNACNDQQRNGHGERNGNAHRAPALDADADRRDITDRNTDCHSNCEFHRDPEGGVTNVYDFSDAHLNRGGNLASDGDCHRGGNKHSNSDTAAARELADCL